MCGFIISVNEQELFEKFRYNKSNIFNHRGPDNQKYYSDNNVSILFRRLSIIDLSKKSDQPIVSKNDGYVLVFNGEIYNYKDLRKILTKNGIKFKSIGEAEVLLKGFIFFGDNFIEKIRGMFSICIWDKKKKKLTTFRDRFGQKPLYYLKTSKGIIFSSEIKDINYIKKCSENISTSKKYLFRNFLDNNRDTFFNKIQRVLPSEKVTFYNNKIFRQIYWKQKINEHRSFNKDEFFQRFQKNLQIHLNSDVKLAFLLSGGLDSSSLVSGAIQLNRNIKAFSILPKNTINEQPYIDSIVKKNFISHEYINVDNYLNRESFEKVLFYQDEPFQGVNCLYQFYLKQKIKEKGYRVLITGDGGDEVLGGYDRMFIVYLDHLIKNNKKLFLKILKLRNLPLNKILNQIKKFNFSLRSNLTDMEDDTAKKYMKKGFITSNRKIFSENWNNINLTKDKNFFKKTLQNSLFKNDLQMSLRMADRNAMASSLENRAPFLDHEFVEYVFSIKTEDFFVKGRPKGMLRESLRKISDNKIMNRKVKSGRPGNDMLFIFYSVFDEFVELIKFSDIEIFGFDKKVLLEDIFKIKTTFKNNTSNIDRSVRQRAFFFFRLYCYFKWKELISII